MISSLEGREAASERAPHRWGGVACRLVVARAALIAIALVGLPASAAAVTPATCGYGTGGSHAGTFCWLDMTNYNAAQAKAPGGQQMTISLPGGYTVAFTVTDTQVGARSFGNPAPHAFPTYSGAWLGNHAYLSTPGKPALYQTANGGTDDVTLSNITVTDSSNQPVAGYGFIVADAESSDPGEQIVYTSDKPLNQINEANDSPVCGGALAGVGTTTVTCPGSASTDGHDVLLEAVEPTTISQTLYGGGLQGGAFAFVTAKLTLDKTVTARSNASDSFDLKTSGPNGTSVGTATTGTASSASTGSQTVLPTTTGSSSFTFGESATPGSGTHLTDYQQSWACTNATAGSATTLPSGQGTSQTVSPQPGDDVTCTITNSPVVDLAVDKSVSPTPYGPGRTLTYTVTVTNNGPANALAAQVSDPLPPALAGAGFTWTCTASSGSTCTSSGSGNVSDTVNVAAGGSVVYTVSGTVPAGTQGSISNTATVTPPPGTIDSGCTPSCSKGTTDTLAVPGDSIQKIADAEDGDNAPIKVGEKISYSYKVTNTGNVPIASFSIDDATVSGVTCPTPDPPGLPPGEWETCTANAPYVVTQSDVDGGGTSDSATVACTDSLGDACPPSNKSTTSTPSSPNPSVAVDKSAVVTPAADQNGYKVGDSIQYKYKLTNTGNVDLASVSVDDPALGTVNCPVPAPPGLAPGLSENCTAVQTHTVTQADVDAGKVTDMATARCKDNAGNACPTSDPSTATVNAVAASPSSSIQKIADASNGDQAPIAVGEQITYSYLVRNTGNVTLTSVPVTDPTQGPVTCPSLPAGGLPPGHSVLCNAAAPYTITQADVDTGTVTDTATVGCIDTKGAHCPPAPPSTITVPGNASPMVSIDKTATVSPGGDANAAKVGDEINYSYRVINDGNIDLTTVSVSDPTIGPVSCPTPAAPGLAPGAAVTCTAQSAHTVTQADVDAGTVSDSATAGCKTAGGTTCGPSNTSTAVVATVAAAPLTSVKKVARVTPAADRHNARPGDKISYTFKVTNIGNVDLTRVSVSDPTLGPVSCPVPKSPGLAPGHSETCTGRHAHVVTKADVKNKRVTNVATGTGTDPRGQVSAVSAEARAAVNAVAQRLLLRKLASAKVARVGQNVRYALSVSDPGSVAIANVTVCDRLPARLIYVASNPRAHLRAGSRCWTVKRLGAHATRKFTITVNVAPGHGGGAAANRATASARGIPTARASATVRVRPAPPPICPSITRASSGLLIAHAAC